jgi:DNA-binding CsgD family transcriptional regulator
VREAVELPPIVGREVELAAIETLVARLEPGPAGLVLAGPAGIGKSRLWTEAVRSARAADVRVLTTRPAETDAAVGFAGLRDLLGEWATEALADLPGPQRDALSVALLLQAPGPAPLDPPVVSASLGNALRKLARRRPLLIAVDDVQWLDPSSRAALAYALRRFDDGEQIGLLATVRTGTGVDTSNIVDALPRDVLERRELPALTTAALHRLVLERYGVALTRPTLLRLHALSGGNPLFALEVARDLGAGDDLSVPRELADLLRARLATLSPTTAQVVLTAALLARPSRELLGLVERNVDDAIGEAVAADVLAVSGDDVRFTHPLLGSVHVESMTVESRRAAHARIAAVVDDPEEKARHLAQATRGTSQGAARALDAAVATARSRGALAAAAELAAMSVSMTPAGDPDRHRRVVRAAELAHATGDSAGAERLLGGALSTEVEDPRRAELLLLSGRFGYQGDHTVAGGWLREALTLTGTDERLRVKVLIELAGNEYSRSGDGPGVVAVAGEAERLAEALGDQALLAWAAGAHAFFESSLTGELLADRFRRAVALEAATASASDEWSSATDFGQVLLDAQELEEARAIFQGLVRRGRAVQHSVLAEWLDLLAFVELHAGNLDLAAGLEHEAIDLAAQTGWEASELSAQFRLGWIEGLRGNVEAARAACERSLRLAARTSGFTRGARLSLGYLESSLEHYDAAWRWLDPSDPATGDANANRPVVPMAEIVEVLAGLGRTDEARQRLQPFADRAAALRRRWAIARAAHCEGLILAAEGDLEAAAATSTEAVGLAEDVGFPVPLGRALLALGVAQRRTYQKAQARATLQRAVAAFESAGARIWSDRAHRELGRIGGRSTPAGGELSATESAIAQLVAAGSSNKEVATALHLSAKTVEWNLSKIYRKVGVRSRTELARLDL